MQVEDQGAAVPLGPDLGTSMRSTYIRTQVCGSLS